MSRQIWCAAALAAAVVMAAPLWAGGGFGGGPSFGGGPGGGGPPGGPGGFGGPGGGLPGMSTGPNVTYLQPLLRASDEEWIVLEPILQRLVTGVDTQRAADAGTLSNANAGPGFGMAGMSNDSFSGPSNIAAGEMNFGMMRGGPPPAGPVAAPGTAPGRGNPPATGPAAPTATATTAAAPSIQVPASSDTLTLAQAVTDLKAALAAKASDQTLKERLAIVRDARAKTQLEVQLAGQQLLPLLTLDQQAALVAIGYLK